MKLSEIKYNDLVNNLHENYYFIDRYTNQKGIKLYLIRTKDIFATDYTDKKNILFTAFPKFYDSSLPKYPEFNFKVTVDTMFQLHWGLKDKYEEFLIHYGFYEFKKWLNEIEEFNSQDGELTLLNDEDTVKPSFINGELEYPYDKKDDLRLFNLAKTKILEVFYKGIDSGKISANFLKEICFVPDKVFELAFKELGKFKLIDVENGTLTSEGLIAFRDENIDHNEQRTFSHTAFMAQAFNPIMEEIYDKVFKPTVETDLNLSLIKINDTDPDEPVDVEILNQIRQSRFMICDLTFSRPSVYFEAGYAIARGIKVFFTARYDHNSDHPDFRKIDPNFKVHFDLRNRQITWWKPDNLDEFKDELKKRIQKFLEYQRNQ